nr:tubulin polyglutamylase complex subunit 2-like [Zootoca vivipara]
MLCPMPPCWLTWSTPTMKEVLPHLTPLSMGDLGPPLRPHLLPHQKFPRPNTRAPSMPSFLISAWFEFSLPCIQSSASLSLFFLPKGNREQLEKLHLDSRSLVFELDPRGGNGKVCFVYKNTKPVVTTHSEIWLLERALYWHFLTKTFTAYC